MELQLRCLLAYACAWDNEWFSSVQIRLSCTLAFFGTGSIPRRCPSTLPVTGTGRWRSALNLPTIRGLPVAVPPLSEQRAIAHILGTLDDKIELNRRMNETLEAMARALFKSWFVDFNPVRAKAEGRDSGLPKAVADLFPDRLVDSELGRIPAQWQVGRVDAEFDLTMGQSPPGESYNEKGEGLPFFQGSTDFGFRFPSRRVYCSAPTRLAKIGDTLISV